MDRGGVVFGFPLAPIPDAVAVGDVVTNLEDACIGCCLSRGSSMCLITRVVGCSGSGSDLSHNIFPMKVHDHLVESVRYDASTPFLQYIISIIRVRVGKVSSLSSQLVL